MRLNSNLGLDFRKFKDTTLKLVPKPVACVTVKTPQPLFPAVYCLPEEVRSVSAFKPETHLLCSRLARKLETLKCEEALDFSKMS